MKEKNVIISIHAKHFFFLTKTNSNSWWKLSANLGMEGNYLKLIKGIGENKCKKTAKQKTVINILNGAILNAFSLRSVRRKGCSLLLLLFNIVVDHLTSAVHLRKQTKQTKASRLEVMRKTVFIFKWHNHLCKRAYEMYK